MAMSRTVPRGCGMIAPLFAFGLLAFPVAGLAQDGPCSTFKWPLERERAWLTGNLVDRAAIGATGGAVHLKLEPAPSIRFEQPPERSPATGTKAALLRLENLAGGTYQITLSDEAWIDVVQNGSRVPSLDFSGVKGCEGMRKSVRFHLSAGPATVQISGAKADSIGVAVAAAQN